MLSECFSRFKCLANNFIVLGLGTLVLASPLQYCRFDQILRTDQCFAVSTFFNESSQTNDFYLLISAKFEERKGFAAFGTGRTMDGAMMIVIYPGQDDGDVTVSLRTTNYHYPPGTSKITPEYRVIKTWVENSYHNAQLVCYSCDEWTRNSVKVNSKNQGWIFANHYEYKMQTNDTSKPLTLHSDYAAFELDMTVSHYTEGTPVAPELVENGRKSVGAAKSSSWTPKQLFAIHGLLLTFAFVIMMPLGVAGIRSGHRNSFKIHWIMQTSSVMIATTAIFLGIYLCWGGMLHVTTPRGTHKLIGFLILLCLGLTPGLGYWHHVRYLKLGRATGVTIWHRRLGASILAGSWVNILLGLFIANQTIWYFIGGLAVMTLSSFVIYSAPKLKMLLHKDRGENVNAYETVVDEDAELEDLLDDEMKGEQS